MSENRKYTITLENLDKIKKVTSEEVYNNLIYILTEWISAIWVIILIF
jgi:hypothetical protein